MEKILRRVEKRCEYCDGAFSVKLSHQSQRFCARSCQTSHEGVHGRQGAWVPETQFSCKECGNPFSYKPSIVRAYRKRFGKDPMYCSEPCSYIGRRKDTMDRQRFSCLQCGKEQSRRRKPGGRVYMQQKFCDRACKAAHQRSKALTRFENGNITRYEARNGYFLISVPSLVTGKKHTVFEHRYVMSKKLERELLKEETVHHKNGIRGDNSEGNLELFNSRHGPGQRVVDKVAFAVEILDLYPEFAAASGRKLVHLNDASPDQPELR